MARVAVVFASLGWYCVQSAQAQTSPPPATKDGSAQLLPPGTITPAIPGGAPVPVEFGSANVRVQKDKKPGGGEFIFAPVPFSNPTIGTGLGLGVGYIFHPNRNDTVSPPSTVILGGLASDNGTSGLLVGGKLYLNRDHVRIIAGLTNLDLHYDFFGVGNAAGNQDISVPLAQRVNGVLLEGLVRTAPNLFMGLTYLGGESRISNRGDPNSPALEGLSDKEFLSSVSAINPKLEMDRRNNTFFPTKGDLLQAMASFHDPAWGDDFSFQAYQLKYAGYQSMGERKVLAYYGVARTVEGDPPFFSLSQVGFHDGLRGYVGGKYRDKSLLSAQVEYRQMFPNRLGFAVFTGASVVGKNLGSISTDNIVASIGVGLRFQLSKENPVNYRVDYAYGKDGGTLYFSVGEVF